jgi:hypothetical protein
MCHQTNGKEKVESIITHTLKTIKIKLIILANEKAKNNKINAK